LEIENSFCYWQLLIKLRKFINLIIPGESHVLKEVAIKATPLIERKPLIPLPKA
jgi:hypothetical protein